MTTRGGPTPGTRVKSPQPACSWSPTVPAHTLPAAPPVLDAFRRDLGGLWTWVGPLCRDEQDPDRLIATLHETSTEGSPVERLAPELEALMAGWPHYDSQRRAVLSGAVAFLAEDDGRTPELDSVVADELVVEAAVRAVLRRR